MTTRPTVELRRQVMERAGNCCEYCLLPQDLAASSHQVDHVIAEKHGGQMALDNLALSCAVCNRRTGTADHRQPSTHLFFKVHDGSADFAGGKFTEPGGKTGIGGLALTLDYGQMVSV